MHDGLSACAVQRKAQQALTSMHKRRLRLHKDPILKPCSEELRNGQCCFFRLAMWAEPSSRKRSTPCYQSCFFQVVESVLWMTSNAERYFTVLFFLLHLGLVTVLSSSGVGAELNLEGLYVRTMCVCVCVDVLCRERQAASSVSYHLYASFGGADLKS